MKSFFVILVATAAFIISSGTVAFAKPSREERVVTKDARQVAQLTLDSRLRHYQLENFNFRPSENVALEPYVGIRSLYPGADGSFMAERIVNAFTAAQEADQLLAKIKTVPLKQVQNTVDQLYVKLVKLASEIDVAQRIAPGKYRSPLFSFSRTKLIAMGTVIAGFYVGSDAIAEGLTNFLQMPVSAMEMKILGGLTGSIGIPSFSALHSFLMNVLAGDGDVSAYQINLLMKMESLGFKMPMTFRRSVDLTFGSIANAFQRNECVNDLHEEEKELTEIEVTKVPNAPPPKNEAMTPVVDYYQKFLRQKSINNPSKNTFEVGEVIEGTFIVEAAYNDENQIDRTQIKLRINQGSIDIRNSDYFLISVDAEKYNEFQQFLGTRLSGKVRITNATLPQMVISNMYTYGAEIDSPLLSTETLNPTPDQISQLPNGTSILLEGKVLEIQPTTFSPTINGHLTLLTPKGDELTMPIWAHETQIEYTGSTNPLYENVARKKILVGDEIRFSAFKKDGILQGGYLTGMVRVNPNEESKEIYEQLRAQVKSLLAKLPNAELGKELKKGRNIFAQLMKLEVTSDEKQTITEWVASLPENQKPLVIWDRITMSTIQAAYLPENDVDRMTLLEFEAFCEAFSENKIRAHASIDESYLYRLFDDLKIDKEFQAKIMYQTAKSRLHYFETQWRTGLQEKTKNSNYSFTVSQSIGYLNSRHTETSFKLLVKISRHYLDLLREGFVPPLLMTGHFKYELEKAIVWIKKYHHEDWLKYLNEEGLIDPQGTLLLPE